MNMCVYLCASILCASSFFGKTHLEELRLLEKETAKTLESKYKIRACGSGGGAMYGIDSVMLAFEIERIVTIEEARAILVGCEELYIKNINSNKKIRPFLQEYPFGPNRVKVEFYVRSPQKDKNENRIDIFSISSGGNLKVPTIRYKTDIEKGGLETIFTETYEQAKERVREITK